MYNLYAILVHTGSAFGGHYFAYIKQNSKWYNFNDSKVEPISDQELLKTFGGDGYSNTAYMLMYSKVHSFTGAGCPEWQ